MLEIYFIYTIMVLQRKSKGDCAMGEIKIKKIHEEYLYLFPSVVTVKDIQASITAVGEEKVDVWTELEYLEVVLQNDSVVFESMLDTFDTKEDQKYLTEHGIQSVFSFNYNVLDGEELMSVLENIHATLGGFIASDTEDLQPSYTIEEFNQVI